MHAIVNLPSGNPGSAPAIRTTVIFTTRSRVVHILHGYSICLPTFLQNNISYTRVPILNKVMFLWDGNGQTLWSKSHHAAQDKTTIFPRLFCQNGFQSCSMTDKLEFFKNHWVQNLLAMCSRTRMHWQWAEPKFHSLLSAHHLIGTYFLTTESDKCMRLLTLR